MSNSRTERVSVCHLGLGGVLPGDPSDGLTWEAIDSLDALSAQLQLHTPPAIVLGCPNRQQAQALLAWSGLSQAAAASAVLVAWPAPDRDLARRLIQMGVQDVLSLDDAQGPRLKRAVYQAIDRKAQDLEVRRAWSIDLGTGLPNRALLVELLNQLCALREREPVPMALLVFRLDGLDAVQARLGPQAAQLLKRKAAVRLRAGLRSSDVVAVVGSDAFAAVLPSMERPQDGERVAAKLAQSMSEPYVVTGQQAVLGIGTGVSLYPDHGRQAEELLRLAYAGAVQSRNPRRGGLVGGMDDAANDD
ncbi:GGDEF domain-containing protein [Sphaerotilus mobilis]|uniref:Diguanylate cyclase (GGDEF)-like protein n=1 Tax=Sphaerotilus mobilis TaxID=47994 RepID=A0A4Q7LR98_9BURK|nr:GGDEF domain-containing protein [Sphaerotilus mobilis]RZS56587.1 diguanylate cyclase (GGDEF)-like protein [Sphaerotilus mobilis]